MARIPSARASFAATVVLVAVAAGASVVAWATLPARVPMHFGLDGRPDRYGSSLEAALAMPIVMLFLLLGAGATLRYMRDLELRPRMAAVLALTAGLFLMTHLMIIFLAGGARFDVLRVAAFGMFAMGAGLGWLLPGTPANGWFGVRTPRTLGSAEVWRRTHERVGRVYLQGGVVGMALCLLPFPGLFAFGAAMLLLVVSPLFMIG